MSISAEQVRTVEFLGSPAAFGETGPVERRDTHGAHVFLCGGTALKLKRAVRYDYMDLSTPDLRRRMLERELELDLPAAPTIYRDVLPITEGPEGLRLGGDGPALDWVLRMNRFRAEDELEAMAERGALSGALAGEIGRMVQRYHAACPLRTAEGAQLIGDILDELGRVFGEFPAAEGTARLGAWQTESRKALDRVRRLLDERAGNGHVRRGHGDLHLRNLVLIEGRPVPFDALEFDERLGTCDVLYDLAFLLMDLDFRGLHDAACRTLSEYLLAARGAEDTGLAALPLFLSVRAAIRAMVLLQTDLALDRPGTSSREVASYIGQALSVLRPAEPRIVAIGGVSGTGKSVLARALAPGLGAAPGAIHLSTDAERKEAAGLAAETRLAEASYTPQARGAVYDALLARAEAILRAGYSVILDGTFLDPAQRALVARLGKRLGVATAGLWLVAATPILERRLSERRGDASDADVAVLRRQLGAGTGPVDWVRVDASQDPAMTLGRARLALGLVTG